MQRRRCGSGWAPTSTAEAAPAGTNRGLQQRHQAGHGFGPMGHSLLRYRVPAALISAPPQRREQAAARMHLSRRDDCAGHLAAQLNTGVCTSVPPAHIAAQGRQHRYPRELAVLAADATHPAAVAEVATLCLADAGTEANPGAMLPLSASEQTAADGCTAARMERRSRESAVARPVVKEALQKRHGVGLLLPRTCHPAAAPAAPDTWGFAAASSVQGRTSMALQSPRQCYGPSPR